MRSVIELLRHERRARVFFAALAQSALGTGAAYVALLLVALERFNSPWAIGLVLLADVVPAMLLGPLFGAFADRWSRRGCAVLADVLRAVAFLGLVVVDRLVHARGPGGAAEPRGRAAATRRDLAIRCNRRLRVYRRARERRGCAAGR